MSTVGSHLWTHFSPLNGGRAPMMVRGEGAYVFDSDGRRYFDGLSSLYCVNVGHGRRAIAAAVADQLEALSYFPVWGYLTPPAAQLADRIAELAPADLDRVFFTSGGSESIESAWKLTRQYHRLRGNPGKTKIVAREGAYHGTTLGALSITGVPRLREPFEPLIPGVLHTPKVDSYHADVDPVEHSLARADAIADLVRAEGPDTVGAVVIEPIQNSGGCLMAEPQYFARLRAICDEHDLLLISDETICSWGRLGSWFGADSFGYRPDLITTAKGLTSGYVPMGAVIASERVAAPFLEPDVTFTHGLTFGGHPAAAAAALANIAIIEDEGLLENALTVGEHFQASLRSLRSIPIVGDVRGLGLFQAVELIADQATRAPLGRDELAAMAERVPRALFERGLICRAMHRGAPILQFAPPLISTVEQLDFAVRVVGETLDEVAATVA